MTLAARASSLTVVVHAIDDSGALCGAEPRPRWRRSQLLPVNCPGCLLRLSTDRYALCGVPSDAGDATLHIRLIGSEGLRAGGGPIRGNTLCGRPAGWDLRVFQVAELEAERRRICEFCRRRYRANAVR